MRIAETPPVFCTACYNQQPQKAHIDWETSYDGPVIDNGIADRDGKITNHLRVSIDELVVCEDCVKAAARLLGMGEEAGEELALLRANAQVLTEEAVGLREYVKDLERAVAAKPTRVKVAA